MTAAGVERLSVQQTPGASHAFCWPVSTHEGPLLLLKAITPPLLDHSTISSSMAWYQAYLNLLVRHDFWISKSADGIINAPSPPLPIPFFYDFTHTHTPHSRALFSCTLPDTGTPRGGMFGAGSHNMRLNRGAATFTAHAKASSLQIRTPKMAKYISTPFFRITNRGSSFDTCFIIVF